MAATLGALLTLSAAVAQPPPDPGSTARSIPPPARLDVPGLKGEPVALTLREVVLTTLAQNLDIEIQLKSRDIAAGGLWGQLGIYDPLLGATVSHGRVDTPVARFDSKGRPTRSASYRDVLSSEIGITQLTPLGSTVSLVMDEARLRDHKANLPFEPAHATSASIIARQPLLKNFGPLVTNAQIRIARRQLEQSHQAFRQQVTGRLAEVMTAYWDLDFSIRNLEVQRQAMESAHELERVTRRRVEVGDLPNLSLMQALAQVASRESLMVEAEARVIDAQDRLLALMNWDRDGAQWDRPIHPAEPLTYFADIAIDEAQAIATALENRPDLKQDQIGVQIATIGRDVARRQRLPELNAFASYTVSGLDDSRGGAFDEMADRDYSGYGVGAEFRYPLFNRQARAAYQQALDRVDQANLIVENRELLVSREVRAAARAVSTALKQIEATGRQVAADEEKVAAERKRLDVGERTIFDVLDFQDDLARSRANHARALANFQIALIELARSTGVLLAVQGVEVPEQEEPRGWAYSFEAEGERPRLKSDPKEWTEFLRMLREEAR